MKTPARFHKLAGACVLAAPLRMLAMLRSINAHPRMFDFVMRIRVFSNLAIINIIYVHDVRAWAGPLRACVIILVAH